MNRKQNDFGDLIVLRFRAVKPGDIIGPQEGTICFYTNVPVSCCVALNITEANVCLVGVGRSYFEMSNHIFKKFEILNIYVLLLFAK